MNTTNNPEENNNSEQNPVNSVDRRKFLQLAASGAAALVGSNTTMNAQQAGPPGAELAVNDAGALSPVRAGSDFMLDVIKSLGFEYVVANPGFSYRSLNEFT